MTSRKFLQILTPLPPLSKPFALGLTPLPLLRTSFYLWNTIILGCQHKFAGLMRALASKISRSGDSLGNPALERTH